MVIDSFRKGDIPHFLHLAALEGWLCHHDEFGFLLETFPGGCFVAREGKTRTGFITSIAYCRSGWVGNLLVREEARGRGIGRLLMEKALRALDDAAIATVWLTASQAGQPLYESLGFSAIDRIMRWRGCGAREGKGETAEAGIVGVELDTIGWGDRRHELLQWSAGRGAVIGGADAFCVLQPAERWAQLGPWGCRGRNEAEALLCRARAAAGEKPLLLDVPEGNHEAAALLHLSGFSERGGTVLMYRGKKPLYHPEYIFALASMGSMG